MSAPSEAERLWRLAHEAADTLAHALRRYARGDDFVLSAVVVHFDAAVRAAFEAGIEFAREKQHRLDTRFDPPCSFRGDAPTPPWLPGAKEDK